MDLTVKNLFNKQLLKEHQTFTHSGFSTTVDVSPKAKAFLEAYRAKYNEEPSTFSSFWPMTPVYLVANAAKGA